MLSRRLFVVLAALALSGCLVPNTLADRPLDAGATRIYGAEFEQVAAALDAAMETLPVNLSDPVMLGPNRVTEFSRPTGAYNWGEIGRVVVTPLGGARTRVVVTVENRYRLQPTHGSEADFATMIFMRTQRGLSQNGG